MKILTFLAFLAGVNGWIIEDSAPRKILDALTSVLDFVQNYPNQINIDAIVCLSIAQAQLEQITFNNYNGHFEKEVFDLIDQCERLRQEILPPMLNYLTPSYQLLAKYLSNPTFWHHDVVFEEGLLDDLGIYDNSTMQEIFTHYNLTYKNISTDECIEEVLVETEKNPYLKKCHVSSYCEILVLGERNDTSYLLTHRLFYLQIARQANCIFGEAWMNKYLKNYCSLILKESRTNEFLGFPNHDIFIEQVLFCGVEGFVEFLSTKWADEIMYWQTYQGCYFNLKGSTRKKRGANTIVFGCNDHTTGLAAAALALNLRYLLNVVIYFM